MSHIATPTLSTAAKPEPIRADEYLTPSADPPNWCNPSDRKSARIWPLGTGLFKLVSLGNLIFVDTDVNGDNKLDLLVACSDDAGIAYLIGKGDGTFNAAKAMPTCDFPSEVQSAQLSDDSKPDLVVACGSPKRLQFYVQVGDLTFAQSPRTADLGRGFFVGDVTGDKKADVLLTESPSSPLLLINTGK